jgi:hypothetical protein
MTKHLHAALRASAGGLAAYASPRNGFQGGHVGAWFLIQGALSRRH